MMYVLKLHECKNILNIINTVNKLRINSINQIGITGHINR